MSILADCVTLEDLIVSAPLADNALQWMNRPLEDIDVSVNTVRKSSGGYRNVVQPMNDSLVRLHKKLKEFFDREVLQPHSAVHGYTKKRGAYTNALQHLDAQAILTIDLSDFFDSITGPEIESTMRGFDATDVVARGITNACTYDGVLATGFSTSPVLSNMYFQRIDEVLSEFAKNSKLVYTRYADDLSFSGEDIDDEHLGHIKTILNIEGLRVNDKKVRFQRRGRPQVVTGYVVAHPDHPRLSRYFKRRLRQNLYYAKQFGIVHQAEFRGQHPEDFAMKLKGQIDYLMGSERKLALKLRSEYGQLLEYKNHM